MKNTNKKRASSSTGKRAQDAVHQTNLTAEQIQTIERLERSKQQMGQRVQIEAGDLSSLIPNGPYISLEAIFEALSVLRKGIIFTKDSIPGIRTPGEGSDTGGGGGGSGDQEKNIESAPSLKEFWKTFFSVIFTLITALPAILTLYERYLTN